MALQAHDELVLRWAPIPHTAQEAFFDDDTPEANLLLTGGWGAGKTSTLVAKMLKLSAINAPLPGIWTVPDYAHIHDTILPTLESLDTETGEPWFLTSGQYHFHETRHVLTWVGGGPILFVTAENPDSIAGPNVAFAGLDEPGSIKQKAWRNTVARVRHPGAKLRQKVAAGTPEGLNYLADLFGPEAPSLHRVYRMATTENVELVKANPHFLDEIRANATEAELAAYLRGQFANLSGALAYPMFNAARHWREDVPAPDPALPLRASFDFNVEPMSCVLAQIIPGPAGPEVQVRDAVFLFASTTEQVCIELVSRYPRWTAGWIVYGDATGKNRSTQSLRSNYDIIRELLGKSGRVELKVPTGNPHVSRRLNSVNRLLRDARDQTRLFIRKTLPAKSCPTAPLVRSLEQTVKKPGTDDIWKKPGETVTHGGDALGYLVDYEYPAEKPSIFTAQHFAKVDL